METLLVGHHFKIKTDHLSLKYLMEQKITTAMQQKWLTKLMGFDYDISYKQGSENKVADALSRLGTTIGNQAELLAISVVLSGWVNELKDSLDNDPALQKLIEELQTDPSKHPKYVWQHGLLYHQSKLVVGNSPEFKQKLISEHHSSAMGGHSGRERTYKRLKEAFYWRGMDQDVHTFVERCDICQQNKSENTKTPGLLQPLPIPTRIWADISMDFVEGLPSSFGKTVIFVVVDRLTKAAHFIALAHPYTATDVAQAFLDNIYKIHGMPSTIVSDRDPIFTSSFWKSLFHLQGT